MGLQIPESPLLRHDEPSSSLDYNVKGQIQGRYGHKYTLLLEDSPQNSHILRPSSTDISEVSEVATDTLARRQHNDLQSIYRMLLKRGAVVVTSFIYIRYGTLNETDKAIIDPWVKPLRDMLRIIAHKATHEWSTLGEKGHLDILFGPFKLRILAMNQHHNATVPWAFLQNWRNEAIICMFTTFAVVLQGWWYWAAVSGVWVYVWLTWIEDSTAGAGVVEPPSVERDGGRRRVRPGVRPV